MQPHIQRAHGRQQLATASYTIPPPTNNRIPIVHPTLDTLAMCTMPNRSNAGNLGTDLFTVLSILQTPVETLKIDQNVGR